MASVDQIELVNKSITATETSAVKSLSQNSGDLIGFISVSSYAGLTSIDVDIEHSPDGSNWFVLDSFTQATGNTSELIFPGTAALGQIRTVTTVAGAGSADVIVRLHFDPKR